MLYAPFAAYQKKEEKKVQYLSAKGSKQFRLFYFFLYITVICTRGEITMNNDLCWAHTLF